MAHKENVLAKETAEKARLAKEAREKAEAERAERAARKRALAAMTAGSGNTQEGVMDSLLEALQTGSAFSRDQRRKRAQQPRLAGGQSVVSFGPMITGLSSSFKIHNSEILILSLTIATI